MHYMNVSLMKVETLVENDVLIVLLRGGVCNNFDPQACQFAG